MMMQVIRVGLLVCGLVAAVIFGLRCWDWFSYSHEERMIDISYGFTRQFDLPWPAAVALVSLSLAWLL
ncbi:MAG: hypothetical protein ACOY4W_03690 [Thermodesulfobacteriota bacterium]